MTTYPAQAGIAVVQQPAPACGSAAGWPLAVAVIGAVRVALTGLGPRPVPALEREKARP